MKTHLAILTTGHGPEACAVAPTHSDKGAFGYLNWHDWAKKKSKTHTQHRCPTCGFWVIWKPKKRSTP